MKDLVQGGEALTGASLLVIEDAPQLLIREVAGR
jgi:hypothetical protein